MFSGASGICVGVNPICMAIWLSCKRHEIHLLLCQLKWHRSKKSSVTLPIHYFCFRINTFVSWASIAPFHFVELLDMLRCCHTS